MLEVDKKKKENKGDYWYELKKFIGKEVIVETFTQNGKILETKGILRALNFQYMNCIIMTNEEKILVKIFHRIRRRRDYNVQEHKKLS